MEKSVNEFSAVKKEMYEFPSGSVPRMGSGLQEHILGSIIFGPSSRTTPPDISVHIIPTESQPVYLDRRISSPFTVDVPEKKHPHYFKDVSHLSSIDVYRVLSLFSVTDPCIQHAVKKLLVAGGRGAGKDIDKDIKEAVDSLVRWQEIRKEDASKI